MSSENALPLADWDELPVNAVEHRIRSLEEAELEELLAHERAHADRAGVKLLLESRVRQLREGGTPSPGGSSEGTGAPAGRRTGSPVTPATSPEPGHGPPHGSPHQMGKGDRQGP